MLSAIQDREATFCELIHQSVFVRDHHQGEPTLLTEVGVLSFWSATEIVPTIGASVPRFWVGHQGHVVIRTASVRFHSHPHYRG